MVAIFIYNLSIVRYLKYDMHATINSVIKVSKYKEDIIASICKSSKNIWNAGIYFCKHWYIAHTLLIKYYIDNLSDNILTFSQHDKLLLLKYLLRKDYTLLTNEVFSNCLIILNSMNLFELKWITGIITNKKIHLLVETLILTKYSVENSIFHFNNSLITFKNNKHNLKKNIIIESENSKNINKVFVEQLVFYEKYMIFMNFIKKSLIVNIKEFIKYLVFDDIIRLKNKCIKNEATNISVILIELLTAKYSVKFNSYKEHIKMINIKSNFMFCKIKDIFSKLGTKNNKILFKKDPNNFKIFIDNVIDQLHVNNNNNDCVYDKIPPSCISSEIYYKYVNNIVDKNNDIFIGSQTLQQTLKKVDKAYKGFFEKKKLNIKDENIKVPKYKEKNGQFNAIFQNNSWKLVKKKNRYFVRLSLGMKFKTQYDSLLNNKTIYTNKNKNRFTSIKNIKNTEETKKNTKIEYNENDYYVPNKLIHDSQYLYIKLGKFGKKFVTEEIDEVEIVPLYNGTCYKLKITYNKKVIESPNLEKGYHAYIDTGTVNLTTIGTSKGDRPIIIEGVSLVESNRKYNRKIRQYSSELKINENKNTDRYFQLLNKKRVDVLTDNLHKISSAIIAYLVEKRIEKLVIGYNTNWKNKSKMGKKGNTTFQQIPFTRLIHMLFYKGKEKGIIIEEINEAYTSICDALAPERIGFHKKYFGKRVKRGLFESSTGVTINADINGQMNIARKSIEKTGGEMTEEDYINNLEDNMSLICKPKKIKLNKYILSNGKIKIAKINNINKLSKLINEEYIEKKQIRISSKKILDSLNKNTKQSC